MSYGPDQYADDVEHDLELRLKIPQRLLTDLTTHHSLGTMCKRRRTVQLEIAILARFVNVKRI